MTIAILSYVAKQYALALLMILPSRFRIYPIFYILHIMSRHQIFSANGACDIVYYTL